MTVSCPPASSSRAQRSGVEKSPPLMVRAALRWEISRLRVSSKRFPSAPYRHAAPLEMTVAAGAIGHTCGVKVQRVQRVQRVQKGRFLGLTGPMGRRVLKFDGPFGPRVVVSPSRAMSMKSALRDLLSVPYGMISILVISRCAAPPYPAAPDFPPSGGQNKTPRGLSS